MKYDRKIEREKEKETEIQAEREKFIWCYNGQRFSSVA